MGAIENGLDAVYGSSGIAQRMLDALEASGLDMDKLTVKDLSPMDEIHLLGRKATLALGRTAGLKKGMHVLDIGCGIGGSARTLASEFGCRITGVDLTEAFCEAAETLSAKAGIGESVRFMHGNALDLPFGNESFDAVVMIHMHMNIENKEALFSEARRVLKPGGVMALWEICSGRDDSHVIYPVPWADDESVNFLVTPARMNTLIENSGFEISVHEDATGEVRAWVESRGKKRKPEKKFPPSVEVVLNNFAEKQKNIGRNVLEGRICVVRTLARRV